MTAVPKWEEENRDSEMMAWADDLLEALEPYASEGVYVNYLDDLGDDSAQNAYGRNWNRLTELKKKWDPKNLFRMNHNIPPSD